ncbi:MAG: hypothetical protein KF758_13735 [Anaerolineales bacterium]|nr:hypothetical protein [Anaerolineales bacterium]MBX3037966.1 hypothetical protein [Anaerolineales bacterium]
MPALIFGMLVVLALVLSIFGLIKNKTWLVVIGAVLFLPFVYYFGGSPNTRIIIVLPFLHFGSAYALYQNNKMMAWSLFSPVIFFVLFVMGIVVINQFGN